MVEGLTGQGEAISFESVDKPAHYLRHYGYMIYLEPKDGGRNPHIFDEDATFYLRKDKFFKCYYSYESVNYPGYYIRHEGFMLKISKEIDTDLYKNDASFKIVLNTEKGNSYFAS